MTPGAVWLTILGLTAVTVVTRSFFLLFGERVELPERLQRALRYAPAAALAAIVAPEVAGLTGPAGALDLSLRNPRLWAALAAGALFALRRRMVEMIAVGMAVFTALRLLG